MPRAEGAAPFVSLAEGRDAAEAAVARPLGQAGGRQLAHRYGRAQQVLEILRLSFVAAAAFAAIVSRQDFVVVLIALGTAVSAFSTMIGGPQRVAMLLATWQVCASCTLGSQPSPFPPEARTRARCSPTAASGGACCSTTTPGFWLLLLPDGLVLAHPLPS